ncbi:Flp pilus assembly protein CpaB [Kordiimonas sp. SCSIO 12603]|uniref:Flp pilus assembly protein CpaB n=1 Tax=Kordiimonas sp. SCSIO 12603 TaxID=2829596 RepID=UPI0021037130|nr:Flp pilus assembly protein CpaB [Kordiimonas sp. SCSIO 12603]UTW59834.1 Flp pilus assembly protein CpaB [Kordiimonas sp. SCSIO 12603]
MSIKKLLLILVAFAGMVLVWFMTRSYLSNAQQQAQQAQVLTAKTPAAQILVAKTDLHVGSTITAENLVWQAWPKSGVNKAYYSKPNAKIKDLVGTIVRTPMNEGDPITKSALVKKGASGVLAATLTPGMRAFTVPVTATSGVAGFIVPGDRVDVILTHAVEVTRREKYQVAETIFQNVRVLATDQKNQQNDKVKVAKTATLEVTQSMAEKLAIVANVGKLSLALRSLERGNDGLLADPNTPPIMVTTSQSHGNDVSKYLPRINGKKNSIRVARGSVATVVVPSNGTGDTQPDNLPSDGDDK